MHIFKVSDGWNFVAGSSFDAKVVQRSVQFNIYGILQLQADPTNCAIFLADELGFHKA